MRRGCGNGSNGENLWQEVGMAEGPQEIQAAMLRRGVKRFVRPDKSSPVRSGNEEAARRAAAANRIVAEDVVHMFAQQSGVTIGRLSSPGQVGVVFFLLLNNESLVVWCPRNRQQIHQRRLCPKAHSEARIEFKRAGMSEGYEWVPKMVKEMVNSRQCSAIPVDGPCVNPNGHRLLRTAVEPPRVKDETMPCCRKALCETPTSHVECR